MENGVKALEIAAGVLLGVILLALIVYFFSSLGSFPEQQENNMSVEQLAAFNMEYEVYNKTRMYGVDVISCLNKAKDNNDKYIAVDKEKFGFLTEGRHPPEYVINVFVNFKNNPAGGAVLEESVEVKSLDSNGVERRKSDPTSTSYHDAFNGLVDFSEISGDTISVSPTRIEENQNMITTTQNVGLGEKYVNKNGKLYYPLLNVDDENKPKYEETVLLSLLEFASKNMRIYVKNNTDNAEELTTNWSSVTWTTALYSLKQKQFRCDEIKYNKKTGRVSEIYFEEV